MKARQIIDHLRTLGPQNANVIFTYLADCVYNARLGNGQRICDVMDCKLWLRELADAAQIAGSTGVTSVEEFHTRPTVTNNRFAGGDFCPDCGHVHIDGAECGFPIGGGRVCRCERAVPA
jgi:hypothetical protein